jgi:hypothetical protein
VKNGSKACFYCGSRFTFEDYELVDSMPADQPCGGCVALYAILGESAQRKAGAQRTRSFEPEFGPVDLTPTAILARLLANRRRAAEPEAFDARMAAAGGERD